MPNERQGIALNGLDGSNPLGFLAAVGLLRTLSDIEHLPVRMAWRSLEEGWRPILYGLRGDRALLCKKLLEAIGAFSSAVLDIGKELDNNKESNKFPFDSRRFRAALKSAADQPRAEGRREIDLLAGLGTDLPLDKKGGLFRCTELKMVRSGDSNRQGMLWYAKSIQANVDERMIERALFFSWDYKDEGYSLRWDPLEDQRYALRWRDPKKSTLADGPATMMAANCLAVEALRCFPVMPSGDSVQTTGFLKKGRQKRFIWPIWMPPLDIEIVRSLLSFPLLHKTPLPRAELAAKGIADAYSALLNRPNKYYSNFAPALPIE
ncbi:MAG: hypothetical protein OXF03_06460 [Gammaproteobacteria bacterium]|nr:hypothetical protein [Gammaproteobacteria bacterium]MCY4340766.1 hypothetical protein [Gammaproteobacteria bacterium]